MQRRLLVVLVACSLAVFGGAYAWATVPLAAGAALVALADPRRTFRFPPQSRVLDLALIASVAALGLQLAPLPNGLVDWISPHAGRVRGILRLDAAMREGRAVAASIEPRATVGALVTLVTAVLVFWSARAAFSAGGVRRFCRALAVIGVILAIEALAQRATSPSLIYGFWRPAEINAQPLGPFINRNHFAGWLLMAVPVVAGYLAARVRTRIDTGDPSRVLHVLAVAGTPLVLSVFVMLVALAASLSRSAIVGLAAAALSVVPIARRRLELAPRMILPSLVMAGVALLVLMSAVDLDKWAARFNATVTPTDTSRLTIWRESLPVLRDFWIAGIGAGTYSMAMLIYQQSVIPLPHLKTVAHFNQAHSHYLQAAIEGGVLVGVPVVIAAAAFVKLAVRALRLDVGEALWMRVGAAAALIGIATQSIWEIPLSMTANAILCAALAGLLVHRRERERGEDVLNRHR